MTTAGRCGRCSTSRTLDVAWHAGQYQALPLVYHQNSALEIAWTRVVSETGTREGRVVAPFFTEGLEGFNVDDETDWVRAEALVAAARRLYPTSAGRRSPRSRGPSTAQIARKTRAGATGST